MRNNIILKTIILILIFISIFFINQPNTYATSWTDGADGFIQAGESSSGSTAIDASDMQEMSDMLYNAFLVVGIIIVVIFGLVIAIKFMTGSVAEKAEVKKTLIPYIAGCVVIFGAFTIWRLVVNLLSNA